MDSCSCCATAYMHVLSNNGNDSQTPSWKQVKTSVSFNRVKYQAEVSKAHYWSEEKRKIRTQFIHKRKGKDDSQFQGHVHIAMSDWKARFV